MALLSYKASTKQIQWLTFNQTGKYTA